MDILEESHSALSRPRALKFSYEWSIQNFHMCVEKNGECITSPTFRSSNCDYSIQLYPYGCDKDSENFVSVYLEQLTKENDPSTNVFFYISILNSKKEIVLHRRAQESFSDGSAKFGWRCFIKRDVLFDTSKGYLNDDYKLTILWTCHKKPAITHIPDKNEIEFQKCKDKCNLYSNLQVLLDNKILTDITLVANGKELSAHKFILMARSPVFAAMFQTDMQEKIESRIKIDDVEFDILSKMLEFMYTEKVTNMDDDCCVKLLHVANKYDIKGLKLICEEYTFGKLTIDNAVEVFTMSELYNCEMLKPKVLKFIIERAKKIINHAQFDVWAKDLPPLFVDIIKAMA